MGSAPLAAVEVLVLGLGTLSATAGQGVMACLMEDTAGRAMARHLLPIALLPLMAGLLNQAGRHRTGLFDAQFQSALDALVGTYLLVGFIWWTARLHQVDRQRQRATAGLVVALETLEHRVRADGGTDRVERRLADRGRRATTDRECSPHFGSTVPLAGRGNVGNRLDYKRSGRGRTGPSVVD